VSSITAIFPRHREVCLGGRTFRVGEFRLGDLADLQDWLDRSWVDPLAGLRERLGEMDAAERRAVLDGFRSGQYTKLVTGRVLNEGVDVPDANVAIVVSGSSDTREYIQRLGRVLRPKSSRAKLYELVSRKTTEGRSVRKRRGTSGPSEPLATARHRSAET